MTLRPATRPSPSASPVAGGRRSGSGRAQRPTGRVAVWWTGLAWIAALAAWEFLARVVLAGTHLLGSPSGMVLVAVENAGLYARALLYTGSAAVQGYLWGNLVAGSLAVLVAVLPLSERFVLRVALVVYCLPLVALGPLLRLVFGLNDGPQVALAALAVYYLTLIPLLVGLRAVPSSWTDLVRSYGRGRVTILWVVRLRACVPYLAAGLQVSVPAAFLGALVGEFTGAERGLGVLSILALRSLDTDGLWALSAISAGVSVVAYVLVGGVGRRLSPHERPLLLAGSGAPRSRRSRRARLPVSLAELAGTVAVVLLGWIVLLRLLRLNPYFAKRPSDVYAWLVTGPGAAGHRQEILAATAATTTVAVPGYVAGLVLGVVLASTFHLAPTVRRAVTPVAVALRCVPVVAIAPLLVAALGRGPVGIAVVVAIMTFFPTLVSCLYGLRQTPGQVADVFATYAAPPWRVLLLAGLPAMMPAFFAAARIAAPSALLAATVAEWLATGTGVGNLMAVAAATSAYGTLWSSVVVVTLLAVLGYGLVELIERRVLRVLAPEQTAW